MSWFPVSDVRLAPLNPGDRVHALFHGSWFPAVLQHIAKDGVQVLWEGENTASCLPACDVVRLADEDAFNLTGKPQQDEGIAASGAGEDCVASDSGAVALDRGCFRDQNEALHLNPWAPRVQAHLAPSELTFKTIESQFEGSPNLPQARNQKNVKNVKNVKKS